MGNCTNCTNVNKCFSISICSGDRNENKSYSNNKERENSNLKIKETDTLHMTNNKSDSTSLNNSPGHLQKSSNFFSVSNSHKGKVLSKVKITNNNKRTSYYSLQKLTFNLPSLKMLNEINNARQNPQDFIPKIIGLKEKIISKNGKSFIQLINSNNEKVNILLASGPKSIDGCINFLKNQSEKKLSKLVINENLKLSFPLRDKALCTDKGFLHNILTFKMQEKLDMKITNFHYDICLSNDPSVSVLLQILDDTNDNYQRRKNIFNPHTKYIGITYGEIDDNKTCYYLLFAQ